MPIIHIGKTVPKKLKERGWEETRSVHLGDGLWMFRLEKTPKKTFLQEPKDSVTTNEIHTESKELVKYISEEVAKKTEKVIYKIAKEAFKNGWMLSKTWAMTEAKHQPTEEEMIEYDWQRYLYMKKDIENDGN